MRVVDCETRLGPTVSTDGPECLSSPDCQSVYLNPGRGEERREVWTPIDTLKTRSVKWESRSRRDRFTLTIRTTRGASPPFTKHLT